MPGIVHYTPPWLSRPSPGFDVFSRPHASTGSSLTSSSASENPQQRLNRTVAHRGTEIFVAVGREIRWSDLVLLRDEWDSRPKDKRGSTQADEDAFSYRVLKASVAGPIKQLIVSPEGEYIAILTSHTAHVAILPDASHLTSQDTNAIKLKTFQLGPTAHVRENPPIACALWHPLAADRSALVTVTVDAVVRLWELDRANRWSFDTPALAVDLRKLANGAPSVEQVTPSKQGVSRGFSPDSFEMEVASACFGAPESGPNSLWSPATLWVAMTEGDIYALCPLLPSKMSISDSQIDGLEILQELEQPDDMGNSTPNTLHREALERSHWLTDILSQNTSGEAYRNGYYKLPTTPGRVPKLQGPIKFTPDDDDVVDITDITTLSMSNLDSDVDEILPDENVGQPLPPNSVMLCIGLDDGTVKIAISLEAPQARWFRPTKTIPGRLLLDRHAPQFVLAESIDIDKSAGESPLMFTRDTESLCAVFVNSISGVTRLSPKSWASKLVAELDAGVDQGAKFRMEVLLDDIQSTTKQIIRFAGSTIEHDSISLNGCMACLDSDLGYFVLVANEDQPYAAQIEVGSEDDVNDHQRGAYLAELEDAEQAARETRAAFQPPKNLWVESSVLDLLKRQSSYSRHSLDKELKMSPHNLNLMMDAHRIISKDSSRLSEAAAEMFRRCERLQTELKEQIVKARQVADRVESVLDEEGPIDDDDDDDQNVVGVRDIIAKRVDKINDRQQDLLSRQEDLRRKVALLSKRPLSDKDRAWVGEIQRVAQLVQLKEEDGQEGGDRPKSPGGRDTKPLQERIDQAKHLFTQLESNMPDPQETEASPPEPIMDTNVSPEKRKARKAQIDALLERQDALIEATSKRLDQLSRFDISA